MSSGGIVVLLVVIVSLVVVAVSSGTVSSGTVSNNNTTTTICLPRFFTGQCNEGTFRDGKRVGRGFRVPFQRGVVGKAGIDKVLNDVLGIQARDPFEGVDGDQNRTDRGVKPRKRLNFDQSIGL